MSDSENESIGDKYDLHGLHITNEGFNNVAAGEEEDEDIDNRDDTNDISEGSGDTVVRNDCPLPRGSTLDGPNVGTMTAPARDGSIGNLLDLVYVSPGSLRSSLTLYNNKEEC